MNHLLGTFFCQLLFMTTTLCRSQTIGDFLFTLFQRLHDRWPYVLHAEADKKRKCNCLTNQGCIDIHACTSCFSLLGVVLKILTSHREQYIHCQTNSDHRYRVNQTSNQEELCTQHWH